MKHSSIKSVLEMHKSLCIQSQIIFFLVGSVDFNECWLKAFNYWYKSRLKVDSWTYEHEHMKTHEHMKHERKVLYLLPLGEFLCQKIRSYVRQDMVLFTISIRKPSVWNANKLANIINHVKESFCKDSYFMSMVRYLIKETKFWLLKAFPWNRRALPSTTSQHLQKFG